MQDTAEKLRAAKPHWFSPINPVQSLDEVNAALAELEATLSVLKKLKQSLAPQARWKRERDASVARATTVDAEGQNVVAINELSPPAQREFLRKMREQGELPPVPAVPMPGPAQPYAEPKIMTDDEHDELMTELFAEFGNKRNP